MSFAISLSLLPNIIRLTQIAYESILDLQLCYFLDPTRMAMATKQFPNFHFLSCIQSSTLVSNAHIQRRVQVPSEKNNQTVRNNCCVHQSKHESALFDESIQCNHSFVDTRCTRFSFDLKPKVFNRRFQSINPSRKVQRCPEPGNPPINRLRIFILRKSSNLNPQRNGPDAPSEVNCASRNFLSDQDSTNPLKFYPAF